MQNAALVLLCFHSLRLVQCIVTIEKKEECFNSATSFNPDESSQQSLLQKQSIHLSARQ
jgi:hypothetical protein